MRFQVRWLQVPSSQVPQVDFLLPIVSLGEPGLRAGFCGGRMLKVAAECGVGSGTVQRIKREMGSRPFDGAGVAA
jgi:hypothetical protein